jgi:hypothetical protein
MEKSNFNEVVNLTKDSTDNSDYFYLGAAYWNLGKKVEAVTPWKEYINFQNSKTSGGKWVAVFPPNTNPIWKNYSTEEKRVEYRKLLFNEFMINYDKALVEYKKYNEKKIDQSVVKQAEIEMRKDEIINKERIAKAKSDTVLRVVLFCIFSLLAGLIVFLLIARWQKAKRIARRDEEAKNEAISKRTDLLSKELETQDRVLFSIKASEAEPPSRPIEKIRETKNASSHSRKRISVPNNDRSFVGESWNYRGRTYYNQDSFFNDHGMFFTNRMYNDHFDEMNHHTPLRGQTVTHVVIDDHSYIDHHDRFSHRDDINCVEFPKTPQSSSESTIYKNEMELRNLETRNVELTSDIAKFSERNSEASRASETLKSSRQSDDFSDKSSGYSKSSSNDESSSYSRSNFSDSSSSYSSNDSSSSGSSDSSSFSDSSSSSYD